MTNDPRIQRLFDIAELFLPAFLEAHKDELGGRKGLYLGIRKTSKDITEAVDGKIIGELPAEKVKEKSEFASEKINRMKRNGELCSFQSENAALGQHGGGIRATEYFVGPSGLPSHLDQKFGKIVCLTAKEITLGRCMEITGLSYFQVQEWEKKFPHRANTEQQTS